MPCICMTYGVYWIDILKLNYIQRIILASKYKWKYKALVIIVFIDYVAENFILVEGSGFAKPRCSLIWQLILNQLLNWQFERITCPVEKRLPCLFFNYINSLQSPCSFPFHSVSLTFSLSLSLSHLSLSLSLNFCFTPKCRCLSEIRRRGSC